MPFLDSPTIRPLYDVRDGGPPVGFRCMLNAHEKRAWAIHWSHKQEHCNRVTRTLAGMRTHQRIVHGIKPQQELNFDSVQAITDQQNG